MAYSDSPAFAQRDTRLPRRASPDSSQLKQFRASTRPVVDAPIQRRHRVAHQPAEHVATKRVHVAVAIRRRLHLADLVVAERLLLARNRVAARRVGVLDGGDDVVALEAAGDADT